VRRRREHEPRAAGLKQGLSDFIRRFSQARSFGERVDRLGELRFADVRLHIPAWPTARPARAWASTARRMAKQWNIARADRTASRCKATSVP
jgi:hypothetical protein